MKCVSNIVLKMIVQERRSFPEKQGYFCCNNVFLWNCFSVECEMPFTFLNLWILEEDVEINNGSVCKEKKVDSVYCTTSKWYVS